MAARPEQHTYQSPPLHLVEPTFSSPEQFSQLPPISGTGMFILLPERNLPPRTYPQAVPDFGAHLKATLSSVLPSLKGIGFYPERIYNGEVLPPALIADQWHSLYGQTFLTAEGQTCKVSVLDTLHPQSKRREWQLQIKDAGTVELDTSPHVPSAQRGIKYGKTHRNGEITMKVHAPIVGQDQSLWEAQITLSGDNRGLIIEAATQSLNEYLQGKAINVHRVQGEK